MAEVLALIPARGGSKSIPRKNIRDVAGKPLIAYTIEHARATDLVDRVIVSTEDPEIARVARDWGAEVPFTRPDAYAQDSSPDIDVFVHALEWLRDEESYEPDVVVHISPPMPLRRPETINRAIQAFIDCPEADSLRSLSLSEYSPYKMWIEGASGFLEPVTRLDGIPEPFNMPRQSLPKVYWQNGYVYIVRSRVVLEQRSMTGERILPFVIEERTVELDYEDSLPEVERLLSGEADLSTHTPSKDRHPS